MRRTARGGGPDVKEPPRELSKMPTCHVLPQRAEHAVPPLGKSVENATMFCDRYAILWTNVNGVAVPHRMLNNILRCATRHRCCAPPTE